MPTESLPRIKRRLRLLLLLEAAERAGIAPINIAALHAYAYLADILSPVWELKPFQARLAKTGRAPYFPDLQDELDILVAMGLVEVSGVEYRPPRKGQPIRLIADYSLNFSSQALTAILKLLDEESVSDDVRDYLLRLADALAFLPQADIDLAATEDATYSDPLLGLQDFIELDAVRGRSRTQIAVSAFDHVFPDTKLPPSRRVVMYAHYLKQKVQASA